jgi:hypothetical protein
MTLILSPPLQTEARHHHPELEVEKLLPLAPACSRWSGARREEPVEREAREGEQLRRSPLLRR